MPIYQNQFCGYCGENPNLTYVCQECHENFCDDCVELQAEEQPICIQCNSTEIVTNKTGSYQCAKCGGLNIRGVKKLTPLCKHCGSKKVIRIETKQQHLLDAYKVCVGESRNFLKPLESTMNQINGYRATLSQLREDQPKCFHFPTVESDILVVFKLFDAAKVSLYDQTTRYFQEIQRNMNYIAEIPITHPSNLFYIEEILKFLDREREKVEKLAAASIEPLTQRASGINEKLQTMTAIQGLFLAFKPVINLENDEKIVYGIKCKLAEGSANNHDYSGKNGTILITNKRLYFLHEQGVFKKRTVLLFSVKLDDLQEVGIKGKIKKQVSLDFVNSMYKFTISKANREHLVQWIETAKNFETKNPIDGDNLKKLEKYKISLKNFQDELENAIYELIGFHGTQARSGDGLVQSTRQILNHQMYRTSMPETEAPITPPRSLAQMTPNSNYSHKNNAGAMLPNMHYQSPDNYEERDTTSDPRAAYIPMGMDLNSRQKNSPQLQPYRTPAGHFGYPHDHAGTYANNGSAANNGAWTNPNTGNRFTQPPNNATPSNLFGNMEEMNDGSEYSFDSQLGNAPRNFGGNGGMPESTGYDISGHTFMPRSGAPMNNIKAAPDKIRYRAGNVFNTPTLNSEAGVRMEITRLQQEEFALNQTLRALEQRFDSGYISNAEFVKSYREMQRELYTISSQVGQLQRVVDEQYTTPNN